MPLLTEVRAKQIEDLRRYGHELIDLTEADETLPLRFTINLQLTAKQPRKHVRYWYITRPCELIPTLEWARSRTILGLDLETSGLDPRRDKIATLQLGDLETTEPSHPHAVVIDVRAFTAEQLVDVFAILEDRRYTKLGQNIGFEYKFLRHHYDVRCRKLADTQVAEMVVRCGLLAPKGGSAKKGQERAVYRHTSMAMLMGRYSEIEIDKDDELRLSFYKTPVGQHSLRQIIYAASDVIYPFVIAKAQRQLIEDRSLRGVIKVEMELIPVLQELTRRGMRVDKTKWRVLWQEAIKGRAEAEAKLDTLVKEFAPQRDLFDAQDVKIRPVFPKLNRPMNYSSSEQIRWVLKQVCEGRGWTHEVVIDQARLLALKALHGKDWLAQREEWGRPATVEDVPDWVIPENQYCVLTDADKKTLLLRMCRRQLPEDMVRLLIEYSRYDVRCDSFGNEWLLKNVLHDTGRVHTEVNQVLNTGRVSSQPNLQNIPNDQRYRECFIPEDGYSFVICDYSQQEPRLTAQVSKDPVYLTTYENNDDLYLAVAEAMLGRRPDRHTKEGKLERAIFKAVVLAMAYRSGARKLRDQLTLGLVEAIMAGDVPAPTFEYAAELHARFFEIHDKVLEYQQLCSNNADPRNKQAPKIWDDFAGDMVTYVRAPCGRLRLFPPDADNTYTEAANAPIQGGSATMTKAAAGLIQLEIDRRGWQDLATIVNLVHDEIVAEVHNSIAHEFAPIMKEIMERAGAFYCPDVKVVAEFPEGSDGIVPFWAKEYDSVA
jgi:DNA polymerase I-like protein with 3'-5' exonuclease and polymerase domains